MLASANEPLVGMEPGSLQLYLDFQTAKRQNGSRVELGKWIRKCEFRVQHVLS